jgi:hypothetical protein
MKISQKSQKNTGSLFTFSAKTLFRMVLGLLVFASLVVWQYQLIKEVYFGEQSTLLGLIINGLIVVLFILGTVKLIQAFVHYSFEERQLSFFVNLMEAGDKTLIHKMSSNSIIVKRHEAIKRLYEKRVSINHSAMASITISEESLYLTFPKFVNNVLIVTGVFGTIMSLIIALAGASDVLKTSATGEGMWDIIKGMNTALNTTATAIVCFFFFTYFFQKLTDIQTYVFAKVEEAVLTYIIPEFSFDEESIHLKTEHLIKKLGEIVVELKRGASSIEDSLNGMNAHNEAIVEKLNTMISNHEGQLKRTEQSIEVLQKIGSLLKEGFRLN